jgi:hypothetical protein
MRILITFIALWYAFSIQAQDIESPPETYISFAPCITNAIGTLGEKFSPTLEVGRQWEDVFSLGLDIGRTGSPRYTKKDTTVYLEIRPNLNVFQVGKFVNTFTPGIGYVFGASQHMMLEFTSGVEYSYTPTLHFNIFFGQYFYSGKESNSSVAFVGMSIAKFFKPTTAKGIIKK